jgi:hypothetical protein
MAHPWSESSDAREPEREAARAQELLFGFASRTGLTSQVPARRYLWTDAFAVTAFLELGRRTAEPSCRELASRLVDQVHHTLGQQRPDAARQGWLSGLSEQEGELHPTLGGLRIGKPLPERQPEQPFDERLEWERDGQYFHYLTQWMHALDQCSRALAASRFNLWARELAQAAVSAFRQQRPGRRPALAWKMSIDLSRPLIAASGQHDALDGFVTCAELRATALLERVPLVGPSLEHELSSLTAMLSVADGSTADPLGIGGALYHAARVAQLVLLEQLPAASLLRELLAAALTGLHRYLEAGEFRAPAARRLAFRELGLSLGLRAIALVRGWVREQPRAFGRDPALPALLNALGPYAELRTLIESFWLDREHHAVPSWQEHLDINEVMLSSSLLPEGSLVLREMR